MSDQPDPLEAPGFFSWKRRMGVHEAYHQNRANRILHWICIPLELFAVVKLLSLVPLPAGLDLAIVVLVIIAPIYLLTEPLMGAAMVGYLALARVLSPFVLSAHPVAGAIAAIVLFVAAFGAQVAIGHRVYEAGRDDTEQNLAELFRTKNPVPILLVFYYHLVEVFLAFGYRPRLAAEIWAYRDREIAGWAAPSEDDAEIPAAR